MRPLVLLPHRDFSLEARAEGAVLDAGRWFVDRVLSGLADGTLPEARDGTARLQRATAQCLLARTATDTAARLRGLGAALASIPSKHLRLRLDDLELLDGSTERSSDVIVAASSSVFAPEIDRLVAAIEEAGGGLVWLERDQQLPALRALMDALGGSTPVEVGGPFCWRHGVGVASLLLGRATLAEPRSGGPRWQVGLPASLGEVESLEWRADGAPIPPGDRAWAGRLAVDELDLAGDRVGAAFLELCERTPDGWIDSSGSLHSDAAVARVVERLSKGRAGGLGAEWWLGAPGTDEPALERTFQALVSGPFERLLGVRAFHWRVDRSEAPFAGRNVTLSTPPPDRDLARSVSFECEGTLSAEAKARALGRYAGAASALGPAAGRLAAAYLTPPRAAAVDTGRLRLPLDAAVVRLDASLSDEPGPRWYYANLATGSVAGMDGRVAPLLARFADAARPEEHLGKVEAGQRERLCRGFLAKGLLEVA